MAEVNSIPPGGADIIIVNGAVYTADENMPRCTAVAVKNGIVLAAGEKSDVLPYADKNTRLIDASGRAVLPGMVDSHMHLLGGSRGSHHNIRFTPEMDHDNYIKEIIIYMGEHPEK